jgi:hypothetical protein
MENYNLNFIDEMMDNAMGQLEEISSDLKALSKKQAVLEMISTAKERLNYSEQLYSLFQTDPRNKRILYTSELKVAHEIEIRQRSVKRLLNYYFINL